MGRRHRHRRPARQAPYKDAKPVILVVTEGRVTEPEYLRGFARASQNPRVRIEIVGGVGAPRTIVEAARELKKAADKRARVENDENLRYDEVWCVFDVDQHPNLQDAKQMARDNGLRLAVSNPCIELWLWLHFADQPGARHRHELQKMIRQHIANYEKQVDYADYAAGYEDARERAKRLDASAPADGEEGRNPTTGVWRLTESIRSDA